MELVSVFQLCLSQSEERNSRSNLCRLWTRRANLQLSSFEPMEDLHPQSELSNIEEKNLQISPIVNK